MLHPLQLKEVSLQYAVEIAEIRDYLVKTGIPVETSQAIGSVAARLRQEPAFYRDLALHIWAISHAESRQVSYADALRTLAVAAAGPVLAAEAADGDTRELLRFVMEARSSSETSVSAMPVIAPRSAAVAPAAVVAAQPFLPVRGNVESRFEPVVDSEEEGLPSFATEKEDSHLLLWSGVAACALLVMFFGFWLLHQPSSANTTSVKAPETSPTSGAAAMNREAVPLLTGTDVPTPNSAPPSRHVVSAPARSISKVAAKPETHRAETTVGTKSAPRAIAPRTATPPVSVASVTEAPTAIRPVPDAPAASPHPKTNARPDSTPPSIAKTSRSDSPVYKGSDNPLVVLHTPVVRPTTLGNMASHLTYGPAPQYPTAAVDQNVQGQVRLEAEVDRSGNVISTRIVSGPALLQEAAVNAVHNWQYQPYLYDGKPVAVNATVVMDFQLQ
jgi:TonB family protein